MFDLTFFNVVGDKYLLTMQMLVDISVADEFPLKNLKSVVLFVMIFPQF